MIANKNRAIQAPAIAPFEVGTHPLNQRTSPGVKWRYGRIMPEASVISPSIDMSIPFIAANAGARRVSRKTKGIAFEAIVYKSRQQVDQGTC